MASATTAPAAGANDAVAGTVHPASRCGECHGALFEEWRTSAHAVAGSSPVYQAMLARAGADAASCRGCHTPLERFLPPADPAVVEGVSCEGCHAIRAVEIGKSSNGASAAKTTFAVADQTKQGPRCDAKSHYFHKMGCAPIFRKSEVCAGCHTWSRHLAGGAELAIFTDYDDWQKDHFAAEGIGCQDCHMPGLAREVAVGARKLADVSFHGDLGEGDELRKKTFAMQVQVSAKAPGLSVEIALTNVGAGHAEPTGMPGRQIVLRAVSLDAAGVEKDKKERAYGRVLVGESGKEVAFVDAVKQASDERLLPNQPREEKFELAGGDAGKVVVTVIYRALSPAIAAALGVPPANDVTLATADVEYGPRARLPRTAKVKP
jgi:hypothetical protein